MFGFVKKLDIGRWMGLQGKPKAVPHPAGYTKTTGPYGEIVNCDTLQCAHCGCHWEVVVGSGRLRGFCTKCADGKGSGYLCGAPACMLTCVPFEARLENIEAGRDVLTPPAPKVLVPELPKRSLIIPGE